MSFPVRSTPAVIAAALLFSSASALALTEDFDAVVPAGWTVINNSDPVGTTSWFQGLTSSFEAHAGSADSYAAANFNAAGIGPTGPDTISAWLVTPNITFNNGDVVSFWTRSVSNEFPDRLELRFSSVGGSDVGAGAFDVGTFTTLLVEVNPTLSDAPGYPVEWTQFSASISGLGGPTMGSLGFRYFVEDGGAFGSNSNYIGIDSFSVTAIPEPAAWMLMAGGLAAVGLRRRRLLRDAA